MVWGATVDSGAKEGYFSKKTVTSISWCCFALFPQLDTHTHTHIRAYTSRHIHTEAKSCWKEKHMKWVVSYSSNRYGRAACTLFA